MNATAMLGRLEETSPRLKARIAGVLCLLTVQTGLTWLSMTGHFRERETSRLSPSVKLRLSFFTWRQLVQSKTSALILGSSSRPVRPMADWNHELGYWLRGALKLWIQHNRGTRQICTPNLGIC